MSSSRTIVALLHPGFMGAAVGGQLARTGIEVRWLAAGRSTATRLRAEAAVLRPTDDIDELLQGAEIVLSICPPQGALGVARLVAAAGFAGTYVDANPVSPATLVEIEAAIASAGASFVDAGIVGPPPAEGRRTHLYLAAPQASVTMVADLFAGTDVTPMVVGTEPGAASAAKQAYALFNKGRMVLAAAAAELAEANGVLHVLAGEADRTGADVLGELAEVRAGLAEVGWRWGPEFAEIAAALASAGVDPAVARACEQLLLRYQG